MSTIEDAPRMAWIRRRWAAIGAATVLGATAAASIDVGAERIDVTYGPWFRPMSPIGGRRRDGATVVGRHRACTVVPDGWSTRSVDWSASVVDRSNGPDRSGSPSTRELIVNVPPGPDRPGRARDVRSSPSSGHARSVSRSTSASSIVNVADPAALIESPRCRPASGQVAATRPGRSGVGGDLQHGRRETGDGLGGTELVAAQRAGHDPQQRLADRAVSGPRHRSPGAWLPVARALVPTGGRACTARHRCRPPDAGSAAARSGRRR